MQDYRKSLGENIKKFRLKKKISQAELGSMLGTDQSFISKIEKGYHYPIKLDFIIGLSECFNVPIIEILIVSNINIISSVVKMTDVEKTYLKSIIEKT